MTANLDQLHQHLLEDSAKGQVVLGGDNFPDELSVRCLGNLLTTPGLTVNQAEVSYNQTKGYIQVCGTCANIYQEKNAQITALIFPRPGDDDGFGLLVNFELSPGRSLVEQFSDQLMMTIPAGREPEPSFLSAIQAQGGEVIFSTFPQSQSDAATALFNEVIPRKAGADQVTSLSCGATIFSEVRLTPKLLGLDDLTKDVTYTAIVTVSGEWAGEPLVCQLPVEYAIGFGPVELSLRELRLSNHRRGGISIGPGERVELAGSLSLGQQSFSVDGDFIPASGVMALSLRGENGADIDVDALANLMLSTSLQSLIPTGPGPLKPAVEQFDVQLALMEQKLIHAELSMSLDDDLELVAGMLKLSKPGFMLAVDYWLTSV